MIEFIIKSTISIGIIYLLYMILLAKENMPHFKRYYLLIGLLFSITVPFIELRMNTAIPESINPVVIYQQINRVYEEVKVTQTSQVMQKPQAPQTSERTFHVSWILFAAYILISVILLIRYIHNIITLLFQNRSNSRYIFNGYHVVLINNNISPYSFMNTIYVSEKDYKNGDIRNEILIHELAHIRQKHSLDILFVELLQAIFWFNPLLMFYKKEVRLNHEYLADKKVINSGINIYDYQNFIVGMSSTNNPSCLVSNFNYTSLKKRLIMLKKQRSLVRAWVKGTLITFLISLLLIIIACNTSNLVNGSKAQITMQNSGELRENIAEISVRGVGSFGYSQGDSVFIEGLEGDINSTDPVLMESFPILKDSSDIAIYGEKGTNGLVIVATKKDMDGKLKTSVTKSTGWWRPILEKHGIKLGEIYYDYGDLFEMGKEISVENGFRTLRAATVLMLPEDIITYEAFDPNTIVETKKNNDIIEADITYKSVEGKLKNENSPISSKYMLIEADTIYHNISSGIFEIRSGTATMHDDKNILTLHSSHMIINTRGK